MGHQQFAPPVYVVSCLPVDGDVVAWLFDCLGQVNEPSGENTAWWNGLRIEIQFTTSLFSTLYSVADFPTMRSVPLSGYSIFYEHQGM